MAIDSAPASGSISLRPANSDDRNFLLRLYASTREEELANVGWNEAQRTAFVTMQFESQQRCYPQGDHRIILLDENPIGRILLNRQPDAILLVDISILAAHRNAGIGSRLLRDLLAEAQAIAKPIRLHVLKTNRAIRLYEELGFCTIGEDGAYFEMQYDPN
jgi:ribosomal protein S18 acetylase RimI-like enzyme